MKKTSTTADPFYVLVGQAIRAVREGQNITQEQVGTAVGLSRTSINNIEKGRQKILLDTFCAIAGVLRHEPQALMVACLTGGKSSGAVDKRLRGLPPQERQFIQEGIAKGLGKK